MSYARKYAQRQPVATEAVRILDAPEEEFRGDEPSADTPAVGTGLRQEVPALSAGDSASIWRRGLLWTALAAGLVAASFAGVAGLRWFSQRSPEPTQPLIYHRRPPAICRSRSPSAGISRARTTSRFSAKSTTSKATASWGRKSSRSCPTGRRSRRASCWSSSTRRSTANGWTVRSWTRNPPAPCRSKPRPSTTIRSRRTKRCSPMPCWTSNWRSSNRRCLSTKTAARTSWRSRRSSDWSRTSTMKSSAPRGRWS